jgi:hypothetical protein
MLRGQCILDAVVAVPTWPLGSVGGRPGVAREWSLFFSGHKYVASCAPRIPADCDDGTGSAPRPVLSSPVLSGPVSQSLLSAAAKSGHTYATACLANVTPSCAHEFAVLGEDIKAQTNERIGYCRCFGGGHAKLSRWHLKLALDTHYSSFRLNIDRPFYLPTYPN